MNQRAQGIEVEVYPKDDTRLRSGVNYISPNPPSVPGIQIHVHQHVQISIESSSQPELSLTNTRRSLTHDDKPTSDGEYYSSTESNATEFPGISKDMDVPTGYATSQQTTGFHDMLRQLDRDIDALSISDTQSIRSTSTYGIGTVGGRALMALGETALSGWLQGNIKRRLRTALLSLGSADDIPTSTYESLLDYQRRGLYSESVRGSAWTLILRGMEAGKTSGLVEALTQWPFLEINEVLYGRAEFLTELRLLAEGLSQYHRSLLLESLMHFDPVDVSSEFGVIPHILPCFAEQDPKKRTLQAVSYIIKKVFWKFIASGHLMVSIPDLLHFITPRQMQDLSENMPVHVLQEYVSQLEAEPETVDQDQTLHHEVQLVNKLRGDVKSYQTAMSTSPIDMNLVNLAKTRIIIRLRSYSARWLLERVQKEWSSTLITILFIICQTDRDATDVGIVALECIVFQLHAGFWVSITESLRELHHTEMAIVLGDLVYMIWSTWYVSPPYYL
ncbi:hypothetical protein EIP86_011545 [Pleurotus ostreatoroseus]|nr:hypothetical protein EIP86_011545 [Pleurotus ostreatoroseus]